MTSSSARPARTIDRVRMVAKVPCGTPRWRPDLGEIWSVAGERRHGERRCEGRRRVRGGRHVGQDQRLEQGVGDDAGVVLVHHFVSAGMVGTRTTSHRCHRGRRDTARSRPAGGVRQVHLVAKPTIVDRQAERAGGDAAEQLRSSWFCSATTSVPRRPSSSTPPGRSVSVKPPRSIEIGSEAPRRTPDATTVAPADRNRPARQRSDAPSGDVDLQPTLLVAAGRSLSAPPGGVPNVGPASVLGAFVRRCTPWSSHAHSSADPECSGFVDGQDVVWYALHPYVYLQRNPPAEGVDVELHERAGQAGGVNQGRVRVLLTSPKPTAATRTGRTQGSAPRDQTPTTSSSTRRRSDAAAHRNTWAMSATWNAGCLKDCESSGGSTPAWARLAREHPDLPAFPEPAVVGVRRRPPPGTASGDSRSGPRSPPTATPPSRKNADPNCCADNPRQSSPERRRAATPFRRRAASSP